MAANQDLSFLKNADNPNKVPGEYMIALQKYGDGVNKKEVAESFAQKMQSLSPEVEVLQKFVLFQQALFHVKCLNPSVVKQINDLAECDFIEANVCEKMIEWSSY